MTFDIKHLAADFPRDKVSWRISHKTKDGTKAMVLAYIDARDVMQRLDDVCGVGGWQSEHFDCGAGKLGCKIGIKIDGDWIWKSDGAGDTKVEAEKGAFSGAFKRAAVLWGIGRYLYDLESPWVAIDAKGNFDSAEAWRKAGVKPEQEKTKPEVPSYKDRANKYIAAVRAVKTPDELTALQNKAVKLRDELRLNDPDTFSAVAEEENNKLLGL